MPFSCDICIQQLPFLLQAISFDWSWRRRCAKMDARMRANGRRKIRAPHLAPTLSNTSCLARCIALKVTKDRRNRHHDCKCPKFVWKRYQMAFCRALSIFDNNIKNSTPGQGTTLRSLVTLEPGEHSWWYLSPCDFGTNRLCCSNYGIDDDIAVFLFFLLRLFGTLLLLHKRTRTQ